MSVKKRLSIITALTLSASLLAACGTDETNAPEEKEAAASQTQETAVEVPTVVYQGLGTSQNFREGPGKDAQEVPVYSFNYITADALFDADGRILNLYVDALEVSTPNYDGETMPHFSGWPSKEGYNITDHATGQVSGVSENTVESAKAEIDGWQTKRDRGDSYGMNMMMDWHKQMDFYQNFFKGKTIAEIEEWNAKYTSDVNGRPLTEKSEKPEDIEKYSKLTDSEKAELADVTTGATFSLTDAHGNIIAAIKDAYEHRVEVDLTGEKEEVKKDNKGSKEVVAGDLKDGTYTVEYEKFDSHGYKPTMKVVIAGGRITAVTYDEVKEDGSKKSEDKEYGSHMEINPVDAYAQLTESAIAKQGTADAVSGATASTESYNALLTYFLEEMGPNGTASGKVK
ncbi:hypothetical protein [Niallia endozanthoxylica]|uniref:hypothetical protein n=1 Tax=Niallia endozanthoxylica TaxID=2036016 RepID=UPI00168A6634|nr:hypothetical protein [Niallia endozanthoxylica]